MKAIVIYNDKNIGKNVAVVCDSAIIRCKDPFFIPDEDRWSAVLFQGIRINRLGKSIDKAFAGRYYDECIAVVHPFSDKDGLSYLQRWGFDGALIVGETAPKESMPKELRERLDMAVSEVSRYSTLKTGDLVLVEVPATEVVLDNPKGDYHFVADEGIPPVKLKVR